MQCDIATPLARHVRPIMRALTASLPEYNMKGIETKCLNTAVMIAVLVLGREQGLRVTRSCDVPNVRARRVASGEAAADMRRAECAALEERVFGGGRDAPPRVVYVMLTNGAMRRFDGTEAATQFPGHVLVVQRETADRFLIMQSYVNHYALDAAHNARPMTAAKARAALADFRAVVEAPKWTPECTRAWARFTHTPLEHSRPWEGCYPADDALLPCSRAADVSACRAHLREWATANGLRSLAKELSGDSTNGAPAAGEGEVGRGGRRRAKRGP
jgi:hypothetical protein